MKCPAPLAPSEHCNVTPHFSSSSDVLPFDMEQVTLVTFFSDIFVTTTLLHKPSPELANKGATNF